MATKDEKGYIDYTQEELNRVPSFEVRDRGGGAPLLGGLAGATGGAFIGAGLGSGLGPAGSALGSAAGAVAGGAAGSGATAPPDPTTQRQE